MDIDGRIEKIQHGTDKYSAEELRNIVRRRNKRLLFAFSALSDQIRIIGDPETPAVIFNNEMVLSVYVANFILHLTDAPVRGRKLRSEKLLDGFRFTVDEIMEYIRSANHRKVYRIYHKDSDLYLAGWNFRDKENRDGKYPVFARQNPKLYFTKEKAKEVLGLLDEIHYECILQ